MSSICMRPTPLAPGLVFKEVRRAGISGRALQEGATDSVQVGRYEGTQYTFLLLRQGYNRMANARSQYYCLKPADDGWPGWTRNPRQYPDPSFAVPDQFIRWFVAGPDGGSGGAQSSVQNHFSDEATGRRHPIELAPPVPWRPFSPSRRLLPSSSPGRDVPPRVLHVRRRQQTDRVPVRSCRWRGLFPATWQRLAPRR